MYLVFDATTGKLIITTGSRQAAILLCNYYPMSDYVDADEEFWRLLRFNESLQEIDWYLEEAFGSHFA